MDLDPVERYYDAVPRPVATTEEVGPFTLFLAEEGTGWQFYARPRLLSGETFTAADVTRVLERMDELGRPRAIEWVEEVTPSLWDAVAEAGLSAGRYPLLALPPDAAVAAVAAPEGTRVLSPDDPDLAMMIGAVDAAFNGLDDFGPGELGRRPALIERGDLLMVAGYDASGAVVGGGSAAPRGEVSELMGIGVAPPAQHQGLGTALTAALVVACRDAGVRTVFLSAGSSSAAEIYRRVGFVDVGTACILDGSDG